MEAAVRFEGDEQSVEARSGAATIDAVETAFRALSEGVDSNRELVMKLRPFQAGSFVVPFTIELKSAEPSLLEETSELDAIQSALEGLRWYVRTKLFLRGIAPMQIFFGDEHCGILNSDGAKMEVPTQVLRCLLLDGSDTERKFSNAFALLKRDEAIRSVAVVSATEDPVFAVDRSQYAYFSEAERIASTGLENRLVERRETLHIVSLSFDPQLKWRFGRHDGTRIAAQMKDGCFVERLSEDREAFSDGDTLEVELAYEQAKSGPEEPWKDLPNSYRVIRVERHNRAPEQGNLF